MKERTLLRTWMLGFREGPWHTSATDRRHDAHRAPRAFPELVTLWPRQQGLADALGDLDVAGATAQQRAEVHCGFLTQAQVQTPVPRQTHAIASLTKVLRDRGDKSDLDAPVGRNQVTRRPAARHHAID